ncbi:MAG: biotin transporter BioY, partial [Coriobacteriia bacterium]|nr:biotin transporter BioY [Coriobacteriia bacterium]
LVGFLAGVILAAWLRSVVRGRASDLAADVVASVTAIGAAYLLGWANIAFVLGAGPVAAFASGVVPFVAFDAAKAVGAMAVARVLRAARVVSS